MSDGAINRITGKALIYFLTNPMYEFHGRCHRPIAVLEGPPPVRDGRSRSKVAGTADAAAVLIGPGLYALTVINHSFEL